MLRLPGSTEAVATLLDAVLAVGSELDLDVLLPRLVRSACYLVGARYGSLGILRQDASGVVESVTDGLNPDDLGLLGVNSSLEVPVMVRGQAFGMLSLADNDQANRNREQKSVLELSCFNYLIFLQRRTEILLSLTTLSFNERKKLRFSCIHKHLL